MSFSMISTSMRIEIIAENRKRSAPTGTAGAIMGEIFEKKRRAGGTKNFVKIITDQTNGVAIDRTKSPVKDDRRFCFDRTEKTL
jgi:hypothetical protein